MNDNPGNPVFGSGMIDDLLAEKITAHSRSVLGSSPHPAKVAEPAEHCVPEPKLSGGTTGWSVGRWIGVAAFASAMLVLGWFLVKNRRHDR